MENETNVNEMVVDAIPEREQVAQPKPKKPRKPKEVVRTVEELLDIPVNKMSEKEAKLLVTTYRKEYETIEQRNTLLDENAKSAYETARIANERVDKLMTKVNLDMDYVQKLTATFAESVLRITGGTH